MKHPPRVQAAVIAPPHSTNSFQSISQPLALEDLTRQNCYRRKEKARPQLQHRR